MSKLRILVVEDDPDINNLLRRIVERAGYGAAQAYSGTEARLQIEHETPDLVLLDMMLPGMDGASFITWLRKDAGLEVPIVVASAKVGLADKVGTLALGADDYITKPFEPEEVVARIQAVLRRCHPTLKKEECESSATVYVYRGLHLDVERRRVTLGKSKLLLTAHEFDILHTLMQSPDKVFSRERLYELVWKAGYYGEENAINVHVSNLRKKLAVIDPSQEYIQTVWGIGFKLS